MINVVHTKQGKSFKGLVSYLMEGSKGQKNLDRVAWTETRNLFTKRPMMAAKVMAATALDQARLKKQAGIANTGRKSKNHVLHYTLSWAKDQKISREEMMRAVNQSLAALGEKAGKKGGRKEKQGRTAVRDQFATEHQVLVVAHNDTPGKEHVHVVVNRVHPKHGVMLPTSNDFKLLSRWAERYERENGGIIVDNRALNNAARDREESVPSQKRVPRDVYELEAAANDNRPKTLRVKTDQRAKDAKLAKESARQRRERKKEWVGMEATHKIRKNELRNGRTQAIKSARRKARDKFSKDWATLYFEHKVATTAFERDEKRLAGRAMNALKALLSLKAPVNVLWSQGARKAVLVKAQKDQERELADRQRQAEGRAERETRANRKAELAKLGHRFIRKRAELLLKHRVAAVKLQKLWKERENERKQAWKDHGKAMEALPPEKSHGAQMIEPDARTKKALDTLKNLERSSDAAELERRMVEAENERLKRMEEGRGDDDHGR